MAESTLDTPADTADDHELHAERAFLARARAALDRMHRDVVSMETPLAGCEDNDEHVNNNAYLEARWRRALALVDLPDVPLFFGRLDMETGTLEETDRIYIGRRHVHDETGTPLVIDWRARVSSAFYRATRDDPMGVRLRRRYGFSDTAELTAYEDERLDLPVGADGHDSTAFLRAEIERPRSGPMRDIVATIQPEQDELVRAPLQTSLCVQGAPGTGKTAIGLHRIAYLLYTERDRLGRTGGVVIVGPNRSFLSYIRKVLPALGEVNVEQTTIADLVRGPAKPTTLYDEPLETARIKGDARMARVLYRALWSHVGTPTEGVLYAKGSRRFRVPDFEVQEIVEALRGTTRYGPGRNAVAQRIAHAVLVRMEQRGESPDDRVQNAVARSAPVKRLLDEVWPKLAPQQVLHRLFSDAEFLASVAGDDLTAAEQAALLWPKPSKSWRSAKWSAADVILLDELADLIERTGSLGHLVVDEAQDLSPMQLRALGRRCRAGSVTVLGDLAQATTPWPVTSWSEILEHLNMPEARLAELNRGFRVPAQIIDFAARLLPKIAPSLGRPRGIRDLPDALRVTEVAESDLTGAVVSACHEAVAGQGSVAVITTDDAARDVLRELGRAGL
ncbi:MAG TPA: AAA family ATPase [Actinopolymorphaceae bacterium]